MIVKLNKTRKNHVIDMIINKNPKTVGIYRLKMKTNFDNFRASAIQDVIKGLQSKNIDIILYDTKLNTKSFEGLKVVNDLNIFKNKSDIIVANRIDDSLKDVETKIYTRDLFTRD